MLAFVLSINPIANLKLLLVTNFSEEFILLIYLIFLLI
jgi:hypothetical protein